MLGGAGAALAAGPVFGSAAMPAAVQPATEKPNILFILGDNHNAGDMGCAGHPFIRTPGMDRLAAEGVRFTSAFNTTSLCSPSRASILTGMYARNHGVLNNHTPWTGEAATFLEHLSGAGYDTAFIGKWHMPGEGLPELPFLDLFVSYTYREGQGAYFNCPMIVNGEATPPRSEYITEEVTEWTLDFIRDNRRRPPEVRRPFCVYLSHRPAHPPFKAPRDIAGMYDGEKLDMPPQVDPLWFGKTNYNVFQGVMMGSYHDQYRKYCETITAMDRDIARLLDEIDRMGLRENTLVIYMADNGMQWGAHGCHGIREPYEDSIKVPMIVRAPWMTDGPGGTRGQLALNIDVAPTLLDIAGLPAPPEMDGLSLLPAVEAAGAGSRLAFLLEFWKYYPENTPSYTGVRTATHKYVEFEKGRAPWLFDLVSDPEELRNLYGTPAGEEALAGMKKLMAELCGA